MFVRSAAELCQATLAARGALSACQSAIKTAAPMSRCPRQGVTEGEALSGQTPGDDVLVGDHLLPSSPNAVRMITVGTRRNRGRCKAARGYR